MTRTACWLYDLRHPITYLQRTMANRYCKRFELMIVDRQPIVRLWSKDMDGIGIVLKEADA